MSSSVQYFWEKKGRKTSRSRFNLLLLEFGEYYIEDFSAYYFTINSSTDIKINFDFNEDLKIQGRLKMSSRSLVFEPNDVRYPLLRFPYKNMVSDLEEFRLKQSEKDRSTLQITGLFTFSCNQYFEMKANNKVGAYKVIESARGEDNKGFRFIFAFVHSDMQLFLTKVEHFRNIVKISEKHGPGLASQHLKPFLENALISTFDSSNLVDFHEQFLLSSPLPARKILPLIINPGSLMLTEYRVYFQPAQLNNIGDASQSFELRKVSRIYKRRHLLRQIGLEFILDTGASMLFVFDSTAERDILFEKINAQSAFSSRARPSLEQVTRAWQRREMTNFQYLMHLNCEAGRTSNDLTQYPVFPHVLVDYKSPNLKFEDESIYRDLSLPVGALNPERLRFFSERYDSMPPADSSMGLPPPFLYGTHYSTPGYVLYYLVRVAPEYMLCLQSGKFDAPDRMFHSISDSWDSCLHNPADIKELIPEFFQGSGEFLLNSDDLDLGHRHSGERLHDVVLPPWADSPRDFIRKHARALESDFVSAHLHEWINLIFGFKQTGEEAIKAHNLFYYLTYEGAIDLDQIRDVRERAALENQIQEFGQTPSQLFFGPHPARHDLSAQVVTSPVISPSAAANIDKVATASSVTKISLSSDSRDGLSLKSPSSSSKSNKSSALQSSQSGVSLPRFGSLSRFLPSPTPISQVESSVSNTNSPANTTGTKANKTSDPYDSAVNKIDSTNSTVFKSLACPDEEEESIEIVHLGDDFRIALESELAISNEAKVDLTESDLKPEAMIPSASAITSMDYSRIRIVPSELFYWHSKSVTGIRVCFANDLDRNGQTVGITVASVGKDSLLKVVRAQVDATLNHDSTARVQCNIARSYAASSSSLSSLILSADGQRTALASLDNHIYSYSVTHAQGTGKRYAHYDGVVSIDSDYRDRYLVSGSLDSTVKLWTLKWDNNISSVSNSGPFLSGNSVSEFTDHEYPICTVAISYDASLVAAGAEDGTVICWSASTQDTLFSYSASPSRRAITGLRFASLSGQYVLYVSTLDGKLICLSSNGTLLAALQLDSAAISISTDIGSILVAGGCIDGSVRLWIVQGGKLKEIQRHTKAHGGPVSTVSIACSPDKASEVLASGSEDCSIRIWRIFY